MYSLAIYIYMFCVNVAALFGNKKAQLMMRGHRNAWKILREKVRPDEHPVWFHAASLGEFEQGRLLIERLKREQPDVKILLTFFSPSGYEVRKHYEYADVVCYLPFDTMLNARKFLRLAHPSKAVFIKYEFWANYLYLCHRHNVPVYSVSSIFRPTQIFFRWYHCGYRHVLKWVAHFFVQNEASRQLLASIGVSNVTVTGDTRLDRVIQIKKNAKLLPIVEQFVGEAPRVFIAGSSWQPDEDIYLPYFQQKEWKLIIATHVVNEQRIAHLRARCESVIGPTITYSEAQTLSTDRIFASRVLLVDCFGLLSSIYRYATVAYVGGGFGVGIHNVPEAAVYGIPVLFGPNNQKFQEAQSLKACGGAFEVASAEDFAKRINLFVEQPETLAQSGEAAAQYISSSAGAADRIFEAIF